MLITFETEVTKEGAIMLPEKYLNIVPHLVTVVITDEPMASKPNLQKAKIMKYAGIWSDLSDEDIAEVQERRQTFWGERSVEL